MQLGAKYSGDGRCEFVVWAPLLNKVEVRIVSPQEKIIPMEKDVRGYWTATVEGLSDKACYLYRLEGEKERPDPASHYQPEGVHNPSHVIDHSTFQWEDGYWWGIPVPEMIMYEIHIGTFTPEGTFQSAISRLDDLKDTGINAIEIMPVAQFPGERNWGYDGVYPFAVQGSYGGPIGLKHFVNECHKREMAVILDVVYNHLGPEGNYLWDYGPYFTDKYKTPWGNAVNFDDAYSDGVRNFFIENALHWFEHYHIDALRLDAIHGITDMSARPFLMELAENAEAFSRQKRRKFYLIAESDLNDVKVIRPPELGGYGMDAQWNDDFHHCLHTLLTGESMGYYHDFGKLCYLVKSLREGFVYSGIYSVHRKRYHGNSSKDRPAGQFVVFSQNHDQIGNRLEGDRLSRLVSFEGLKIAAGMVILSPYIPLLFMGEEYGEDAPFMYFVSHSDPDLVEAVREGRKHEFRSFMWKGEPLDPQGMETFRLSKIVWGKRESGNHRILLNLYRYLIQLRKSMPVLAIPDKDNLEVCGFEREKILCMRRWKEEDQVFCIFSFNRESDMTLRLPLPEGRWKKILDSSDIQWAGTGSLLPGELEAGVEVTVKRLSFSVFHRKY